MKTIGAFEAKTHLSELLDLAAMGERFLVTKRGKPVAMIVPPEQQPTMTPSDAVAGLRALRTRITLGDDLTVRDLIDEGRR
jgi:prevent-host-death family protein